MISITFKRDSGKLIMTVDAKEFVEYLQTLGCKSSDGQYLDNRPYASSSVCGSDGKLSPKALVRLNGPHDYNLSEVFSSPPTTAFLQAIGESAEETARAILDHYRPVEIRVRVLPKPAAKVKPAATDGANTSPF